jgi:prophage regulatory protein
MLRLPAVEERTGLARSSIYRAMEEDGFPRPVRIGRRAVAWVEAEVEAWLDAKLAARGSL